MTTTRNEDRAEQLGRALQRLASELVTERDRTRTLRRENAELRAELAALRTGGLQDLPAPGAAP